jgi:uncharacterized protein DUF3263
MTSNNKHVLYEVPMDSVEMLSNSDSAHSGELERREREILAFERQWWKYAGAKEQAIRELFDMSATRYYQVLNALMEKPAAMAADPMLIKRLRRQRIGRRRIRAARRFGIEAR